MYEYSLDNLEERIQAHDETLNSILDYIKPNIYLVEDYNCPIQKPILQMEFNVAKKNALSLRQPLLQKSICQLQSEKAKRLYMGERLSQISDLVQSSVSRYSIMSPDELLSHLATGFSESIRKEDSSGKNQQSGESINSLREKLKLKIEGLSGNRDVTPKKEQSEKSEAVTSQNNNINKLERTPSKNLSSHNEKSSSKKKSRSKQGKSKLSSEQITSTATTNNKKINSKNVSTQNSKDTKDGNGEALILTKVFNGSGEGRKRKLAPTVALRKLEEKKMRLDKLEQSDGQKAKKIITEDKWIKATKQVKREKLQDDSKLLKKTIKRQHNKKKKSKEQWEERKKLVEQQQLERQKKRRENIQARIEKRKLRKRK